MAFGRNPWILGIFFFVFTTVASILGTVFIADKTGAFATQAWWNLGLVLIAVAQFMTILWPVIVEQRIKNAIAKQAFR